MSPKNLWLVSLLTLVVSIGTLALVWQMQNNLAHTRSSASTIVSISEAGCDKLGGTWTQLQTQGGDIVGYECGYKDGTITHYDNRGVITNTTKN